MNQLANINPNVPNAIVASKGDIFRILNQNIPLNNYHLPDHIYRADLVGQDVLSLSVKDKALVLESASMPITFDHGYPAINETTPMWEQLPCEPADAYNAYMVYLELPEKSQHDNPIRLLPLISTVTKIALKTITDWCHMYYWHWRARAYDLFLIAAHRKQREQRIMSIEGAHFKQADELLQKVQVLANRKLDQEINAYADDPDAQTESKLRDIIGMAKELIQIQRISVGLPANGISNINMQLDGPRHTTAGETFKHIAKESAGEDTPGQRSAEMDTLLANPDDLSAVQELMIKLHRPDHVVPAWGNGKIINPDDDADSTSANVIDAEAEDIT
jgi:hypothetical protein